MQTPSFKFQARVWIYPGNGGWHFITIPKDISSDIKRYESFPRRGFGSMPVKVTVGKAQWKTSIFPEKKGTYILPVKKEVRAKENIQADAIIKLTLELII